MKHFILLLIFFLHIQWLSAQAQPERFVNHKVNKKETLYGLSRTYGVTVDQILEFNPLVKKIGLKKKMQLKIPVYPVVEEPKAVPLKEGLEKYLVQPKETKWRLAYRYGITIDELEKLNPQISDGLKVGQEIVVPKRLPSETQALEAAFNYYKVKPKEGFYRLEKKLGLTQADLVALNPTLTTSGLQAGMILKVPPQNTGELAVENDLLIERTQLEDSVFQAPKVSLAVFLPFKSDAIELDSVEQTKKKLSKRNLHTIALDFYMGMMIAIGRADSLGITTALTVFDSHNRKDSIRAKAERHDWSNTQAIVGPLIPSNFNMAAILPDLNRIPMVAPLSSKAVKMQANVYQSVTDLNKIRMKMLRYIDQQIDTTQNVVIIADTLNHALGDTLAHRYPFAHRVRPELGGFVVPDLIDSLLTDSLPNKVVFESQDLNLVANVTSLLNAQAAKEKEVQLLTSLRLPIYDNENISKKHLGAIRFTYLGRKHPKDNTALKQFKESYQKQWGDYPSKDALRAYDVTLDLILRLAYRQNIYLPSLGPTDYLEGRFHYLPSQNGQGFENVGHYLLQHDGYTVKEIKK